MNDNCIPKIHLMILFFFLFLIKIYYTRKTKCLTYDESLRYCTSCYSGQYLSNRLL